MRSSLFQINGVKKEPLILPEADGPVTTLTEKVYVPVKEHPDVSIRIIAEIQWRVTFIFFVFSLILLEEY